MAQIQFNQLLKMENDGLVFYGLIDELENFKSIINKELNDKNIGTGNFEDKFKEAYEIYTQDGRRDIVLEFADKPKFAIGKVAIELDNRICSHIARGSMKAHEVISTYHMGEIAKIRDYMMISLMLKWK